MLISFFFIFYKENKTLCWKKNVSISVNKTKLGMPFLLLLLKRSGGMIWFKL